MKNIFKILLGVGTVIFVAGVIFLISIFYTARTYHDQINSTIHVVIEMQEDMPDLKTVELHICAEINSFTRQALKDTVSKNIGVPYKAFPCKTFFRYVFEDGTTKEIQLEDFNCAGCSGSHGYALRRDSVAYTYWP